MMTKKSVNTQHRTKDSAPRALSQLLQDLLIAAPLPDVSLAWLRESLHERGLAMILLIFAMPMALPLPVPPGINVLLATPLLILTLQMALGRHTIWFPQSWLGKTISHQKFTNMIRGSLKWVKRGEMLLRPRLAFITQRPVSQIVGLAGFLMACTVTIPLPLTNTAPSFALSLIAAGTLMRDGLVILLGVLIGLGWIFLLGIAIFVAGPEAFELIKGVIRSWISNTP